jgi:hypothetical protein
MWYLRDKNFKIPATKVGRLYLIPVTREAWRDFGEVNGFGDHIYEQPALYRVTPGFPLDSLRKSITIK